MEQAGAKREAQQAEELPSAHCQQNLAGLLNEDLGDKRGGDRAALAQLGRQLGDQAGDGGGILRTRKAYRDGHRG
jgi:hypothetical protein